MSVGLTLYISHLRTENNQLTQNINILTNANKTQQNTINQLNTDINSIKTANAKIEDVQRKINTQVDSLNKKFERDSKTFTELSNAKPNLIENIINAASKEKLRCIELITGQKLNKDEKIPSDCYIPSND